MSEKKALAERGLASSMADPTKTAPRGIKVHMEVPLGIPQDTDMPPGLSPGARTLFRALKALNRHGDPDRMMDDVNKGRMDDG